MSKLLKNFYFGAASQPFQAEGARNIGGRTDSIWDEFTKRLYYVPPQGQPGRELRTINTSADLYHKYPTDARIMKRFNINCFRSAIDWTRIFPRDEDYVNPEGIKFYDNLFRTLVKNNIKPGIIIFQWDIPMWVELKGGWTTRKILQYFRKYARTIYKYFGKYTDLFFSTNESRNMIVSGYTKNYFPPQRNEPELLLRCLHYTNLAAAICKEEMERAKKNGDVPSTARLGFIHDWEPGYPLKNDREDERAAHYYNVFNRDIFYDPLLKGEYPGEIAEFCEKANHVSDITAEDMTYFKKWKHDFIGWNAYKGATVTTFKNEAKLVARQKPDEVEAYGKIFNYKKMFPKGKNYRYTKWSWPIMLNAWEEGAIELTKRYNCDVFITENGLGDFDVVNSDGTVHDWDRINYLKDVYEKIISANEKGARVIGLAIWSYCDVFSPSGGYRKQYGLVRVDMDSPIRERHPKASLIWNSQVAASFGEKLNYDKKEIAKQLSFELSRWDLWYK